MTLSKETITLRQPDDWHLHLRDGALLNSIVSSTASVFHRAVIMPNLSPPITSIQAAIDYRERILKAVHPDCSFMPLMTVYLTDEICSSVVKQGFNKDVFFAAKLYPANSTTNSVCGVSNIKNIYSVLETMEEIGMPLLIHGEVVDPEVDVFDREVVFLERHLQPILQTFPKLRVVLEHITTEDSVQFIEGSNFELAATITPHHLHINRNAMFFGGLNSDFFCLPVAKREKHRLALRKAATSGNPCFFLGTDSAPHLRQFKENSCGCAGIFNAPNAIESYAQVFEEEGALEKLEDFSSTFGAAFYQLPLNKGFITLIKQPHTVSPQFKIKHLKSPDDYLVPFHAGETLNWAVFS